MMKKLFLLTNLLILFLVSLTSYAFEPKYAFHTSKKDIEYKQTKALKWYEDNEHPAWLKNRALNWYDDQITKGKFYFVHTNTELDFTKKKALRWYEANSK